MHVRVCCYGEGLLKVISVALSCLCHEMIHEIQGRLNAPESFVQVITRKGEEGEGEGMGLGPTTDLGCGV